MSIVEDVVVKKFSKKLCIGTPIKATYHKGTDIEITSIGIVIKNEGETMTYVFASVSASGQSRHKTIYACDVGTYVNIEIGNFNHD